MKNALISPLEQIYSFDGNLIGIRIADVSVIPFEVAEPLYWIECADEVLPDIWYFQSQTQSCQLAPIQPPYLENLDAPETIINVDQTIS